MGESLAALLGVGLAIVWFGGMAFLYVGGITYRKDCLTTDGRVTKGWTVQWFAPVPYLFRPSEQGCEVHTGTRVALSAVGVGAIPEATRASLVDKVTSGPGVSRDDAYWGKVKEAVIEYTDRNGKDQDLAEGKATIDSFVSALEGLTPTPKYQQAHQELLASAREIQATLPEIVRVTAPDATPEERQAVQAEIRREAVRMRDAVDNLNTAHGSG